MRAVSLISLSLITGGLLALFGLRADTPWNPFYAPYPQGKIEKVVLRSYREAISTGERSVSQATPLTIKFAIPKTISLGNDVFLAVSAKVKTKLPQESALSLSDGTNIAHSAPISASEQWQTITTLFPHEIKTRNFQVSFNPKTEFLIEDVYINIRKDGRYLRKNCSKTEVMLNGLIGRGFDVNERLNYPKKNTTRIVVVGNSTVQGCGSPNGGTFTYALQHKLDILAPKKFQVMNYGIPGASFLGHIVSITNYYPIRQENLPSVEDALYYLHRHPSLKDLDPDYVILSVLWNDLENYIDQLSRRYSSVDEKSILANKLLLDETLESFLLFIDNPSFANETKYEESKSSLEEAKLIDRPERRKLFEKHLSFLLERYLSRIRLHLPNTKVLIMSLPDRHDSAKMILEANVQRDVYTRFAKRFELPFIDLAKMGEEDLSSNTRAKQFASAYLFQGKIHFKYRGNQWLADRAFPEIETLLRADNKL
jgi:hypothetical protein